MFALGHVHPQAAGQDLQELERSPEDVDAQNEAEVGVDG